MSYGKWAIIGSTTVAVLVLIGVFVFALLQTITKDDAISVQPASEEPYVLSFSLSEKALPFRPAPGSGVVISMSRISAEVAEQMGIPADSLLLEKESWPAYSTEMKEDALKIVPNWDKVDIERILNRYGLGYAANRSYSAGDAIVVFPVKEAVEFFEIKGVVFLIREVSTDHEYMVEIDGAPAIPIKPWLLSDLLARAFYVDYGYPNISVESMVGRTIAIFPALVRNEQVMQIQAVSEPSPAFPEWLEVIRSHAVPYPTAGEPRVNLLEVDVVTSATEGFREESLLRTNAIRADVEYSPETAQRFLRQTLEGHISGHVIGEVLPSELSKAAGVYYIWELGTLRATRISVAPSSDSSSYSPRVDVVVESGGEVWVSQVSHIEELWILLRRTVLGSTDPQMLAGSKFAFRPALKQ